MASSSSSSLLESRVDDITICSICFEDFKSPRSLPCLHSFCLRCLQDHCKNLQPRAKALCPLCRVEFAVPQNGLQGLRVNFVLQDLIETKRASGVKTKPEVSSTESNSVLKLKFKKLQVTIVDAVNAAKIIDFLFQEEVIGDVNMRALQSQTDQQQQCRDLLGLLHTSPHPQAFVKLYLGINKEPDLQWLVDRIDAFTDQSVISLLQQLYISQPNVGQVVHQLPEGPPVFGVTSLGCEVFVLREKDRDQVEVYDVSTFRLLRRLTVPNIRDFTDMTSCEHHRCVYICDHIIECIHTLDSQGSAKQWPVKDKPYGLSVNRAHNLLVTCRYVRKIKEFSTHGHLLREVTLPDNVLNPWQSIQLTSGQFVVCHGDPADPVHGVCMVTPDGRQIVHSHGRQHGSRTDQYNVPGRLTVDRNQFVFVADVINRRVTLLSPTLGYVRQLISRDLLNGSPVRLYSDPERHRLYVADNKRKGHKWKTGRVAVFTV